MAPEPAGKTAPARSIHLARSAQDRSESAFRGTAYRDHGGYLAPLFQRKGLQLARRTCSKAG
jgi:hypothetical protein